MSTKVQQNRNYDGTTIPGPSVHVQRATIEVRRLKRLMEPEWKIVSMSPLGHRMVLNRFAIFNIETPFTNNYTHGTGGAILKAIEETVTGNYYVDVSTEAGRWAWTVYFEHESDCVEIATWVKMKFDGLMSSTIDADA